MTDLTPGTNRALITPDYTYSKYAEGWIGDLPYFDPETLKIDETEQQHRDAIKALGDDHEAIRELVALRTAGTVYHFIKGRELERTMDFPLVDEHAKDIEYSSRRHISAMLCEFYKLPKPVIIELPKTGALFTNFGGMAVLGVVTLAPQSTDPVNVNYTFAKTIPRA